MKLFDSEASILQYFRDTYRADATACFPESDEVESIVNATLNESIWVDASSKTNTPPDFYSDSSGLMMEVMRVNESERKKNYNPVMQREREIYHELKQSGLLDLLPNDKTIIINAKTDLTTDEHHCYEFYQRHFSRILNNHIKQIPKYRKNHPGKKLIFFVLDESEHYFETTTSKELILPNQGLEVNNVRPHCFFLDDAFVKTFITADIDYLIWFTPWKTMKAIQTNAPELPQTCVYDITNFSFETVEYDPEYIITAHA